MATVVALPSGLLCSSMSGQSVAPIFSSRQKLRPIDLGLTGCKYHRGICPSVRTSLAVRLWQMGEFHEPKPALNPTWHPRILLAVREITTAILQPRPRTRSHGGPRGLRRRKRQVDASTEVRRSTDSVLDPAGWVLDNAARTGQSNEITNRGTNGTTDGGNE